MSMPKWKMGLITVVALTAVVALTVGLDTIFVHVQNQFKTTEFRVEGKTLFMEGEINSRTLEQFDEVHSKHPGIETIVQLDVPGSLDDDTMIALAYRVRALGLNTHLTSTSEIYSGGVDLFLAGVKRTMEPGATLGVHSWSDGIREALDYPRDAPEHEQNRLYIEKMLGDDAFYWYTIHAAPADGIHIMTNDEIKSFNLLTDQSVSSGT